MSRNKYAYGTMLIATDEAKKAGKPEIVYVVTHTAEDDIHIKLSGTFPYTVGKDPHFFVHTDKIKFLWHHSDEGIQIGMFGIKQDKKKKKKPKRKFIK